MKTSLLSFAFLAAAAFSGCHKPAAPASEAETSTAYFKTGHGVMLPEPMRRSLGVETVDVAEQKFVPQVEIPLHVPNRRDGAPAEASGWISGPSAQEIRPGQTVRLLRADGAAAAGVVREVRPAPYAALGDFEVTVTTTEALPAGEAVTGVIEGAPTAKVVTVPKSAVMKTAEGEFVYVSNEDYFARTAVRTAARNDDVVEIADGLFSGDQVVCSQVALLWMTELQTLRAGQSCCAGH